MMIIVRVRPRNGCGSGDVRINAGGCASSVGGRVAPPCDFRGETLRWAVFGFVCVCVCDPSASRATGLLPVAWETHGLSSAALLKLDQIPSGAGGRILMQCALGLSNAR